MSDVQLLRVSVHERISAAAEDFLLQLEKGGETARVPALRAMLTERLTAAGEEILAVLEDKMERSERQRRLLEAVMKPELRLHRVDVQQLMVNKEQVPPVQQQWSPLVDQEDPEPPYIKEELEEPWTNQEGEQLQQLEQADIKFPWTAVTMKSEEDEEKPELSQLHQSQTEENRADCGEQEPARNSGPDGHLQQGTEDKTEDSSETVDREDDWMQTREPQSGLNSKNNKKPLSDMKCKSRRKTFDCSECGKRFRHKSSLILHIKFHTGERPLRCSECGQIFKYNYYLTVHMMTHTGERPYSCSECGKGFKCKGELNGHVKTHIGEKLLSCSECGERFRRKIYLTAHMETHKEEKLFSCSECGRRFKLKGKLAGHMKTHRGEKLLCCSECGERFRQNIHLTAHMKTHTEEKLFSCPKCGEIFRRNIHLTAHMMIHSGEKPYSCSKCRKRFKQKDELTGHMETHTEEKLYSCPIVDQEDQEPPHIKEQQEEPWTNQEGEQLQEVEQADIKFPWTAVTMKSEEDEEKPELSQLYQSQTEENRADCGEQEAARNSGPDGHLQQGTEDKAEDSSETEDDWFLTWEPQSGLNSKNNKKPQSDLKTFDCSECGRRFLLKSSLTGHMETHTEEKLYSCPIVDQEDQEPPHIKEQQEEQWTNQEGEQLQEVEQADIKFPWTAVTMESEEDEEKPELSHIHQSETEENRADRGEQEPARNSGPYGHLQQGTEDKAEDSSETEDDWFLPWEPQSGLNSKNNKKPQSNLKTFDCSECGRRFLHKSSLTGHMETHTEEKLYSCPIVDQEDQEPPHIKEQQEEPWTNQEGEQLQQLEQADIKFPWTAVTMKSEEDEEKPELSQPHQSQTEENRADRGEQEPARNSGPYGHLQQGTEDKAEDSSETEDDWFLTWEPQSGLNSKNNKKPQSNLKTFDCSECGRRFLHKSSLTGHMETHKEEKLYSCSKCGKRFKQKDLLTGHMKTHREAKLFSCPECGSRFLQKRLLTVHMRDHTEEKPFIDKRFRRMADASSHY
ncbi:zinc finger protein 184 [Pleuronectes platessa]|uniref:zinc finger protein 184 n=1 Tax=Pleuronectes platessa TaxID=8262 RepID=UPI00232A4BC9|nr:zinc finger protein 184 [Pleuronectes platessa]